MKVCMIGLGSIGTRHLNNIITICKERNIAIQIDVLRSRVTELDRDIKEMIQNVYYRFEDLLSDYDVIFITNPTHLHFDTLVKVIEKTKHIFIEKPLFNNSSYKINDIKLKMDQICYIACPLRYTPVIQYLKNVIKTEFIYSVRAISSSYLPSWRKNVDYRKVYSAKKSLGGGVTLDLIHEWDYLIYLFGNPQKVLNLNGKYSNLEIDSDDISIYIAQYKDKLVEVHLDYFGQDPVRALELYCKDYVIYADLRKQVIEYKGLDNKVIEFKTEDFYMNEMNYFFDIITKNVVNTNDLNTAYKTLQLIQQNNSI